MIYWKKVFLFIISLAFMAALLYFADLREIFEQFHSMDITLLVSAALLQLVTIILIVWQWRLTSKAIGKLISWDKLISINMLGTFFECITPALKAGSELTRVYFLKSHAGLPLSPAVSMVILQKAISIFTFIFLNIIGLICFLAAYSNYEANRIFFAINLIALTGVFLLLIYFMTFPESTGFFLNIIPFIPERHKDKAKAFLGSFKLTVSSLLRNTRLFTFMIIQAFVIWLLYAVKAYIITQSFGIGINFTQVAVATLFSYMVAMIPLFPGGLGSFEAAYSFMFVSMGFDINIGIAAALILRLVTFWFVFFISVLYLVVQALVVNIRKIRILSGNSNKHTENGCKYEL